MSFASAFLGARDKEDSSARVEANLETLLQAISPEWVVGPELENVQASNLCFGVPMNWALAEGRDSRQMRSTLRDRLNSFEPRLVSLSEIDVQEDTQQNTVTFYVAGAVRADGSTRLIEIEKKLSRMDQNVEGGR